MFLQGVFVSTVVINSFTRQIFTAFLGFSHNSLFGLIHHLLLQIQITDLSNVVAQMLIYFNISLHTETDETEAP